MSKFLSHKPIFILGNPRSGTSLLRLMLHSHSHISIPPESHFFLWLEDKYKNWNINRLEDYINDLYASTKLETWNINYEDLFVFLKKQSISSYGHLTSLVYYFYSVQEGFSTANYWGDKNSLWIDKLPVIKKHFPDAFYIHIVRDGRDVACSYRSLNKKTFRSKYAPKLPNDIDEIAKSWQRNVEAVDSFFVEQIDEVNKITILYEDLIQSPRQTLSHVLNKLSLQVEKEQLNYYLKKGREIEPTSFLEWKEKLQQPLDIKNIGKYRKELSLQEVDAFNLLAKNALLKYNYL